MRARAGVRARVRIRNPFHIFENFPELRVGLFAKEDHCSSDEECAERLGFQNVGTLNQVHGNVIHMVETPLSPPPDGDGLITATLGLALSVRFADCQTFVIYAPNSSRHAERSAEPQRSTKSKHVARMHQHSSGAVIGVVHAGWRGIAAKIITAFYDTLKEHFGIMPGATFVGAGPSLCKQCAVFSDPHRELPEHLHAFIDGSCVDLISAADAEFDALGVPKNHRERHPACTKCDRAWLSFRRDRNPESRNYLVAGLSFCTSRM